MSDDEDVTQRQTPATTDRDWRAIWRTVERQDSIWPHVAEHDKATRLVLDQIWPVLGPVVMVLRNWKAIVAIIAALAWYNSPEVIALFESIRGVLG